MDAPIYNFVKPKNKAIKRLLQCSVQMYSNEGFPTLCAATCCPRNTKTSAFYSSQNTNANISQNIYKAIYARNITNGGRNMFVYGPTRPFIVNYLGRMEGQLGGSGQPPRNRLL
jgi:hypothetical protein